MSNQEFEIGKDCVNIICKKIKNPAMCYPNNGYKYEGSINNFKFTNIQQRNYNKIQEALKTINTTLLYIHAGERECKNRRLDKIYKRMVFIAYNDDKSVVWHKYEGSADDGGQNWMYINGKKYKTTDVLEEYIKNNNINKFFV